MDGLTDRGSHLLTDCHALNNNARRDPHFPCHRQKTDNEGSPRFDAVDADQTGLVIVHNLISHRGSRTNPTGACSHASACFYRLVQQQQPAAPGLVFVRERRGSVPWNSYQLSLSFLFFRAAKTREATPFFFIIVIICVVSAVAGNFTDVPDYNRAAIALSTPRNIGDAGASSPAFGVGSFQQKCEPKRRYCLAMFVLESRMLSWRREKKGAEKRSMSINQSLLSTNTLSFITNTWNQAQASCEPTLREKGKKKSGKRSMSINQNLLSINTLWFITNTWNQPQGSCGPTLREKEKRSEKRGISINQRLLSTNTLSLITNIRNQSQASLGPTLWSSSSISFRQQLYQAITAVSSSSSSSSSWTSWTKVPSKHPPPPLRFLS